MNIAGLDKAEVLAALYNGSRQQGMGFCNARGTKHMSADEARVLLESGAYFDYLYGRVMKIDLSEDDIWTGTYNRDNGPAAAELIIDKLRLATK